MVNGQVLHYPTPGPIALEPPPEWADLRRGFPLPVWVICDLLGVPDADRDRFAHWSDTLLNLTRHDQVEIVTRQRESGVHMTDHVASKRGRAGAVGGLRELPERW